MPQKPITTFATAIAFGVLASAAIAAPEQQQQAATSGSECHAAPKGVAPEGAHWYYKTDRATNKKCWYLADKVAKTKKATSTTSTRSSESDDTTPQAASKADNKPDKSVADARAEIPADRKPAASKPAPSEPAADQGLADSVWPALPDKPETDTAAATPPSAPASDDNGAFASRWPDQVSTAAATDAQVMLARKQAEQQQAAAQPQPQQPQPAVASTVGSANAATTDEPAASSISTTGLLLSVLAGLLALAAIIGPAVFKRVYRRKPKAARRDIWDSVDHDNPPLAWDAKQDVQNDNKPHEIRDLDAVNDKLQQILERASKRSAA